MDIFTRVTQKNPCTYNNQTADTQKTSTQCVNSHSVQVTLVNGLSMPQCSIYQPRAASQTAFLVVLTGWLIILSVAWVNRHKRGQITRRLNPYSRETYTLRAF